MNITALGSWVERWGKTKTFGRPILVGMCFGRVFGPAGPRAAGGAVAGAAPGPLAPGGLSPPPAASGGDPARQRRPSHGSQPVASAAESGRGRGGGGRGGLHRQHGLQQALALRRPQRAHPGAEARASRGLPLLSPGCRPPRAAPSCPGSRRPYEDPSPGPGGRASPRASCLSPRGPQNCLPPLSVLKCNGRDAGVLLVKMFYFCKIPNICDHVNALLTCNACDAVGFCSP